MWFRNYRSGCRLQDSRLEMNNFYMIGIRVWVGIDIRDWGEGTGAGDYKLEIGS